MFREIIDRIKEAVDYIMGSRLVVLIVVFCVSSSILIGRLFYLQIIRGEDYLENYELQIRKTRDVPATRGNIYDRNGELLAYNKLAYSVTIEDTIPTDTSAKEKNEILNEVLDRVLTIVEEHGIRSWTASGSSLILRETISSQRPMRRFGCASWRTSTDRATRTT